MKILQVCPKYYPSIGGVEQHVRNTSERLAHDHDVTVFACDPSGQLPREELLNGVKVIFSKDCVGEIKKPEWFSW